MNRNMIRSATAAAAALLLLSGCGHPAPVAQPTPAAVSTSKPPLVVVLPQRTATKSELLEPMPSLQQPNPESWTFGQWSTSGPFVGDPPVIGGRWPVVDLMSVSDAGKLKPGTPICFWSRGRDVGRCGPLISVDAAAAYATVGPPSGGSSGYVMGDMNARTFLIDGATNEATALGCLTSITPDGGFGVSLLEPALAHMGWQLKFAQ